MVLAPTLSVNGSYGLATVEYNAVVVSGAGTISANGTYTERGVNDGKPYYNLVGASDTFDINSVYWGGEAWGITGEDPLYTSDEDVAFPWQVVTWSMSSGDAPAPTLTPATV
jgi:predicted butyrate kinase (DUF1464 family)